ncbi:PLP-dependent aminotransferase family protein [Desulfosediminicola flagellatus]|uniref:aminotransferase-like domain-containing protein n=1 Tax=Desulfosediminicola flagellatus TaxID=2569541 RepID=UPI0010ABD72D|nr:PLP-dependent aminotransferase family protein [Desulfosediminicola flagellatus]
MEYQYLRLANDLERKIRTGNFKAGEKLPSLRNLRAQTGRSISTIYQAYNELEDRGVVEVREKSGFYVRPLLDKVLPRPIREKGIIEPHQVTINSHSTMLQQYVNNPEMLPLGTAIPSPELLPLKQLAREVRSAAAGYMTGEMIGYGHPTGISALRTELAKRSVGYFSREKGEEIIVTSGCMDAIDLCLRAVAREGDVILIESPTFLCYLQLIEDLNMKALEVPVDSETGFDMDQLEQVLSDHDVRAALLNANFHNPLGYVMSNSDKKRLVEIITGRGIPLIEDDIYGDLYFTETRPVPLKSFDTNGLVLYCSSFTKSLAPDLRVGWTIPGRFKEKVKRIKFNSTVVNSQLNQVVAARFLATGAYERHLRKMRNSLKKQAANMVMAVARYFPEGTRVSAPQGGICLWVELDKGIDSLELFERASKENIAIVPGNLCSVTDRFSHCIRLNCGYPWSERFEEGVRKLGVMVHEMLTAGCKPE